MSRKKNLRLNFLIVYILFSTCLLVWPFSIGFFYSQLFSLVMFFLLFIIKIDYILKVKLPRFDATLFIFGFFLFIIILNLLFFGEGDYHFFIFYLIKFFLFYVMTYLVLQILYQEVGTKYLPELLLFNSIIFYLIFILLQVLIPSFNAWTFELFATEAAIKTLETNMSGHKFRHLGWNGFLFASDGIAFAFTAILLLTYRKSLSKEIPYLYLILTVEFFCVALAAISGRSAMPLIFLYLMCFFYNKSFLLLLLKLLVFVIFLFFSLFILNIDFLENSFMKWFFEPIYSSIERGELFSTSTAVTNEVYFDFFKTYNFNDILTKSNFFYYKSNMMYVYNNYIGADSGFIRVYYALGFFGLILFLGFWVCFILRYSFLYLKHKKLIFFTSGIFIIYSLAFFYKSEWLYQNFFIFYFFVLYHSHYNSGELMRRNFK